MSGGHQSPAASRQVSGKRLPWLLTAGCWLLCACGFEPLHSQRYQSQLTSDLSSVTIVVDNSRLGQLLEAEIRQGVNPELRTSEKLYTLKIALTEREIPLFINPDGTSSRGDIEYTSSYVLSRKADGKPVQRGAINRVASYNSSQAADYASFVSIEDAKTRGILELAQAYKLRLSNLLPSLNGAEVPASREAPPPVDTPYPRLLVP